MNDAQKNAIDRAQHILNITGSTENKMAGMLTEIRDKVLADSRNTELQPTFDKVVGMLHWLDERKGTAMAYLQAAVSDANYPVEQPPASIVGVPK